MNKLVHLGADSETTKEFSMVSNDFFIRTYVVLTDTKKLLALEDHFKPGKGFKFTVHIEYGKKWSFNPSWLDNHNWLVYSPTKEEHIVNFVYYLEQLQNTTLQKIDNLVKSPLSFRTTACEKLKDHGLKCALHKTETLKSENFYEVMKTEQVLIDVQLNTVDALNIECNKQKLASLKPCCSVAIRILH